MQNMFVLTETQLLIDLLFFILFPRPALAHVTQEKFDATFMHVMPEIAAQERMVDNGAGQVEVVTM